MSKKAPRAPQAPDPAATVTAQAAANRINQFTPQGNLIFGTTRDGEFVPTASGQASSQLQESDAQRQIRELTESTAQSLGQQALTASETLPQDPLTTEGLPGLLQGTVGEDTSRVEQAIFDRGRGLLDPVFDRREEDLRQSLANRGQPLGFGGAGERTAANAELELFGLERGNALNNLALDAVRGAGAEQSRQFGVSSAARGQLFNERAATRSNRFNELASLLGIQPVQQAQQGQFFAPSAVDVVGPANTAFQGQLNAFNNQQANRASNLGGLFNLGGALGSAAITGGLF